ncbi:hypothetical protein HDU85_004280 [Gaertneriomyces sp. JEL0708]|nr:hypothetical protein HDU85_004280 [Gaertneriomyces sp. JEL0708]
MVRRASAPVLHLSLDKLKQPSVTPQPQPSKTDLAKKTEKPVKFQSLQDLKFESIAESVIKNSGRRGSEALLGLGGRKFGQLRGPATIAVAALAGVRLRLSCAPFATRVATFGFTPKVAGTNTITNVRFLTESPLKRVQRMWTELEDQELKRLRDKPHPWKLVAERLGRTESSCRHRYHNLDSSGDETKKLAPWTEDEDKVLHQLIEQKLTWKVISSQLPGRTVEACRSRYRLLQGKATASTTGAWSKEELDALREEIQAAIECQRMPEWSVLARKLGRERWQVTKKGTRMIESMNATVYGRWTAAEEQQLLETLKNDGNLRELAVKLGRPPELVRRKANSFADKREEQAKE